MLKLPVRCLLLVVGFIKKFLLLKKVNSKTNINF
nr:MAG TPA: hypothetical protein [Caudoviricetes sp.]DAW61466.1 MAG TPA: hypothetical protein [Caudoviricetes sp.]